MNDSHTLRTNQRGPTKIDVPRDRGATFEPRIVKKRQRLIKARGHFPSEQAALKCLYLVTRSLDPTGVGGARWTMQWKPALNAFAITFSDRFPAAETY